jgi:predicted nucleotide-binding protein
LLISGNIERWDRSPAKFDRSRAITHHEYTVPEISNRYGALEQETIDQLKIFPSVFAYEENGKEARVGYINDIKLQSQTIEIDFEFDRIIPAIAPGKLNLHKLSFGIASDFELRRTHWALKDVDLFVELVKTGLATKQQIQAAISIRNNQPTGGGSANAITEDANVFIVHGHDDNAKLNTARFVESLGLKATILHEAPNTGRAIIEKFEGQAAESSFAIVLLTPDDVGYVTNNSNTPLYRARQNVIFELGYFCGLLSRAKVFVLCKQGVEMPNDYLGVVYTPMDDAGAWKLKLAQQMKNSGLNIDMTKVQ